MLPVISTICRNYLVFYTLRSTKKVAQHNQAAHKLALLDSCPQTFVSAGEDGLIIMVDVREPQPTTLLVSI